MMGGTSHLRLGPKESRISLSSLQSSTLIKVLREINWVKKLTQMTKKKKSSKFTLLEILIVLVILGFIGGVVGVQLKKLLDNHHFETEVSDLFLGLQEAQLLAACYQTDISLDFYQEGG